jgi:hypothetical protein
MKHAGGVMQAHLGFVADCPSPSRNQSDQFVVAHEVCDCISITDTTLITREALTVSEILCTWEPQEELGIEKDEDAGVDIGTYDKLVPKRRRF